MVAALFHSVLAVETAAEQGKKVVLLMLAVGAVFVGIIALGELAHRAGRRRRR